MELKITDNTPEMIEIGKRIIQEKPNIYNPQMLSTIAKTIDRFADCLTELSKEQLFCKSVYDY